jgi:hypothetical protein
MLHHYQRIYYGDSTDHAWNTKQYIDIRGSRESSHGKARSNHTMMLHARSLYDTMVKEQQYDCSQKRVRKRTSLVTIHYQYMKIN